MLGTRLIISLLTLIAVVSASIYCYCYRPRNSQQKEQVERSQLSFDPSSGLIPPKSVLHVLSDNKIYPGTELPGTKLHIVGNGRYGTPPEQRKVLFLDNVNTEYRIGSPCPSNPLEIHNPNVETVLSITSSHNILIGSTVCEGEFQFVISADKEYRTIMTPEEYDTISAVIERAVTE